MASLNFEVDFEGWARQLEASQMRVDDLSPVHERIGSYMIDQTRDNIESGGGAETWPALKPETIEQRNRKYPGSGSKPLIVTRQLINSIEKAVTSAYVDVGSALEKAKTLFFGSGNVPGRSPFGWQNGVMDRVGRYYLEWIVMGWL